MKMISILKNLGASRMFLTCAGVLIAVVILGSCSKESFSGKGGDPKLVINVAGIVAQSQPATNKAESAVELGGISSSSKPKPSIKVGQFSMDVHTSKEEMDLNLKQPSVLSSTAKNGSNNGSLRSAVVKMDDGVKYRVLLFNTTSNRMEKAVVATAGVALEIDVFEGQTYKWYAYSYNSSDQADLGSIDLETPNIYSQPDMPLLYATGEVTSVHGSTPISINFQHQMAQLRVEVDTKGMFADIVDISANYAANTVKGGEFNLLTGAFQGNLYTDESIGLLNFTNKDADSEQVKVASYYTADVNTKSFQVEFFDLKVKLMNGTTETLTEKFPDGGTVVFGDYTGSSKGKILNGVMKMWKVFPRKTILHVEGEPLYSYGASVPTRASGAFLRNPYNFGPQSDYMRIEGFNHEVISVGAGKLQAQLANPATYPDVVIAGMFSGFNAADYDALYNYIERGGVVFLMIETETANVENFMSKIFGTKIDAVIHDVAGCVYKMTTEDADVLNYCFGDVRGMYWGQDGSHSLYLNGIPESAVVSYSGSSRNRPPNTGLTMFRHKTKHFFYVGDTSFLSCNQQNGEYPYYIYFPFATTTDGHDFPVPKSKFGESPSSGSPDYPQFTYINYTKVYNSVIFGNVFARLVATSHYMGINRNP